MPSPDGTALRCRVCCPEEAGPYLKKKSSVSHLKSKDHQKAVREYEDRQARINNINRRIQEENQRKTHRETRLVPLELLRRHEETGSVHNTRSAAEEQFLENLRWESSEIQFDAGEDPHAASIEAERRWQAQVREFGIWDPHKTARELGFRVEETVAGSMENEEDQLLSDLLAEFGTSMFSL